MEYRSPKRGRSTTIAATSLIAIAAASMMIAAQRRSRPRASRIKRGFHVEEAITINRPLNEVYQFWRSFENHPRFMSHLDSVQSMGGGRSRWRAKGPAGLKAEWDAEIVDERDNEWLAWRSLDGSDVKHRGAVSFDHAPGARGTEVRVELEYSPPAGAIGAAFARLFGHDPEQQLRDDLRRFKQLLEAGEIAISDGPGLWRPARPAERPEELRALMGVER